MHLSSILSAMAKAVSTYVNVNLEKKNSKQTSFTLSLWIKIFRRIYTPLPPLSHPTMSNFLPHLHLSAQSRIHCGQAISRGLETFLQFQQGPSDNIGNTHVHENTHKHSYMLVLFMRSGILSVSFIVLFKCWVLHVPLCCWSPISRFLASCRNVWHPSMISVRVPQIKRRSNTWS